MESSLSISQTSSSQSPTRDLLAELGVADPFGIGSDLDVDLPDDDTPDTALVEDALADLAERVAAVEEARHQVLASMARAIESGATTAEMAQVLGVTDRTVNNIRKEHGLARPRRRSR